MLEYKQKRNNGRTPFAGVYKFVCVCGCVCIAIPSNDIFLQGQQVLASRFFVLSCPRTSFVYKVYRVVLSQATKEKTIDVLGGYGHTNMGVCAFVQAFKPGTYNKRNNRVPSWKKAPVCQTCTKHTRGVAKMLEYKQKRNNGRTSFAGVYKFGCVCVCSPNGNERVNTNDHRQ